MCVCGTLFRDLEVTKKQKRPDQEPEQPPARRSLSNASSSALMTSGMPEVEELRSLLEKGDISVLFSQEELSECPRLSSSLVNLPTYVTSEVNLQFQIVAIGMPEICGLNLKSIIGL